MSLGPELSSMSTALEDLTRRVAAAADRLQGDREDMAVALYEVERSLNAAQRRLDQVVGNLT